MDKQTELEYIGQRLLEKGFKTWFLYMFKAVRDTRFIVEPLHDEIFNLFQDLFEQKELRVNLNIPPRSAKTTMAEFFIAYSLTINPKCNFIYTSYSQSLLAIISSEIANILEHPIYKALYPQNRYIQQDEEINPVDNFWLDYLQQETNGKKNTYTSKKIITYAGSTCLFTSIGAQITGMGCGQRTAKGFSGALIIDDGNKPSDIRSQVMRDKVLIYFEETLLSRLNNPKVSIINIQQRLHIEDLSGILEHKYNFKTIKKPLLDDNGNCLIPSQYTAERIEELKKNNYMFSAQYMQNPIILGGAVIKSEWFGYYPTGVNFDYKRIFITGDTAMKVKQWNDYSVLMCFGLTSQGKLHILDMIRGKWEAPELKRKVIEFWNKWVNGLGDCPCSAMYIEDKASGVGLIQDIKANTGIPIIGLQADKDKLERVEMVLPHIESGNVLLPVSKDYDFNPDLIRECEEFTRDDSHKHDDMVDTLVYGIREGLSKIVVSIFDVV